MLEVETVPDAQVDAVVHIDGPIPVEVFRLVDLVGRRDPSVDLSRPRRCDLGLAGRRLACVQVPAGGDAHQHKRGGDQQPGRDPSATSSVLTSRERTTTRDEHARPGTQNFLT